VQRADAAALIAAGNTHVADPAQIWGNPTIEDELKLFANFGSGGDRAVEFYPAFLTSVRREGVEAPW